MLDPAESTSWYGTDNHADLLEEAIIPYIRNDPSRSAVMIRARAKIKPEHLLYLRGEATGGQAGMVGQGLLQALSLVQVLGRT
ncbi:hypothetical protein N7489_007477 [Penicillium chrysogenum]|uniref:uncharacterized protein n=1 Tax=Penicillium chrysogenum TaxID=5076 RepID=UPI002382614B|nr:uncharacterized protein N7489_007477 [Penicillium chrysogenum]KAJ5237386.1 hypothetical protein N7489_007477 [Penicillium chrysogenum]KAJ5277344.1 hypothetical protein N7524_003497 [Penicillium chrysogenum]